MLQACPAPGGGGRPIYEGRRGSQERNPAGTVQVAGVKDGANNLNVLSARGRQLQAPVVVSSGAPGPTSGEPGERRFHHLRRARF